MQELIFYGKMEELLQKNKEEPDAESSGHMKINNNPGSEMLETGSTSSLGESKGKGATCKMNQSKKNKWRGGRKRS